MTKIINLWGGPGTGKSTTASDLFALMKWEGESVELVLEFAKDLTWDEHFDILSDQLWVSANQNRRVQRVLGKVDYIITDCPLLLCSVYATNYFQEFLPLIQTLHDSHDNIEVFLKRQKKYVAKGRSQDKGQAIAIDVDVQQLFKSLNRTFDLVVDGNKEAKYAIYNHIKHGPITN